MVLWQNKMIFTDFKPTPFKKYRHTVQYSLIYFGCRNNTILSNLKIVLISNLQQLTFFMSTATLENNLFLRQKYFSMPIVFPKWVWLLDFNVPKCCGISKYEMTLTIETTSQGKTMYWKNADYGHSLNMWITIWTKVYTVHVKVINSLLYWKGNFTFHH